MRPSTLKTENEKKNKVGYVYIEESFDTIFNMGYGGGLQDHPMPYASGKSPMLFRVKTILKKTPMLEGYSNIGSFAVPMTLL